MMGYNLTEVGINRGLNHPFPKTKEAECCEYSPAKFVYWPVNIAAFYKIP